MPDDIPKHGGDACAALPDAYHLNSLYGAFTTASDGRISYANATFLTWTGYSISEVIGKRRFEDFLSPAAQVLFQAQCYPILQLNGAFHGVALSLRRNKGGAFPVLINGVQRRSMDGASITDYTLFNAGERLRYEAELRKARQDAEEASELLREVNGHLVESYAALHEQSERLRITLNAIGDGVLAVDRACKLTFINPAAADMCGCEYATSVGLPLAQVFCPVDEETGGSFELTTNASDEGISHIASGKWVLEKGETKLAVSLSATPMRNQGRDVVGHLIVVRDISAAREFETRLRYQATHDALTQLINRPEFERLLTNALKPGAPGHTLMYLDLDQFKIVNDTCGHAAGDELLRQLAHIMRKTLRKEDTLARLGGDEFGVLLRRQSPEEALLVADRLRQTVREFDFVWGDYVFPIGVSIGFVALVPGQMQIVDAMRIADSACYVAKGKGRNRVHVVGRDDADLERHKGEISWISRLHAALRDERFVLFGQKIVALKAGQGGLEHIEVLIRMEEVDGTLVSPMAFIPAAERYGIMPQIDRWVISTVLQRYHALHGDADKGPTYAINLSGTTLCDESFLPFVRDALAQSGVPPHRICFEVTETAAIANLRQATSLMVELKAMGCLFSLDDFGSGMSSFGYLKHLPVDYLKIDGRFVKDLLDDRINYAMVEAINRIGQVMGLFTIAEFVENAQILEALREIGVDFAQGYQVHRPQRLLAMGIEGPAAHRL